jgi:predicted TIM-barrel fold metal-dependent hydrolase
MPVLDAHTHIFPPYIIEHRELIATTDRGFAVVYGRRNSRMIDAHGLQRYMDDQGPDVAVAVGFPFEDNDLIRRANDYLLEIARADKRVLPLVAADRKNEDAAISEVERCLKQGARGVGELAYYDTGFGENERRNLESLGRYLEEKGMVLMLHLNEQVGHHYAGKTYVDFASVVRFVEDHPTLEIILAHMGGGICFYEFMPEIKKTFSHVYYDLAATPFLYSENLYAFAAAFLDSKVLFGSDYPLLPLGRYRPQLDKLDNESRVKILYENGRHLFGA